MQSPSCVQEQRDSQMRHTSGQQLHDHRGVMGPRALVSFMEEGRKEGRREGGKDSLLKGMI